MEESEGKAVLSLITTEAHRLSNGGRITSEAFQQARENIAKLHYPDKTGLELASEAAKAYNARRGTKKANGNGAKPLVLPLTPGDEQSKKRKPFIDLYREWVETNDTLPSDLVFVHFMGVDESTSRHARAALHGVGGYEFERIGPNEGWRVTKRPPKTEEIMENIRQAVESGNKTAAIQAFMDLIGYGKNGRDA